MKRNNNYNKRYSYRRRRKAIIRRWIAAALTVILTASIVFGAVSCVRFFVKKKGNNGFIPAPYSSGDSKKVLKAKELEVPDFVDVQLINKHSTARTGKKLSDISYIVVHYVGNPGTTAQNNRDYFNKSTTDVSSHFVVGLDGEIIQCVPIYEKSAASNERNKDSISIEVCHPDESGKFNEKTYNSLIKLIAWLMDEFSLDESQIIRHYDVTGKICPKYYVENEDKWEKLKSDVKKSLNEK